MAKPYFRYGTVGSAKTINCSQWLLIAIRTERFAGILA